MWQFLTGVHVLVGFGIIALVLLQRGKGADAGAGFGAGASGTVFGARGSSTFFSKLTAALVTCFFVTSLSLAYMASHRTAAPKSLLDQVPASVPAVPAPAATTAPVAELPAVVPEPAPAPAPAAPAGKAP